MDSRDHSHPEHQFKTSTDALTTVYLSVAQSQMDRRGTTFEVGRAAWQDAEEMLALSLGLVALTAVRHPEWFMAHALAMVEEQFSDLPEDAREAVVEWVMSHAPVVSE